MSQVIVYAGLQTAEKVKAANLVNMNATDFSLEENVSTVQSEAFQNVQAQGDTAVSKIEIGGGIPVELTAKTLEMFLPGISYKLADGKYTMSTDKPSFYTIVLEDTENNQTFTYLDCVLNTLNIKVALGAYITADLDFIGKDVLIETGAVSNPQEAGESMRALFSAVTLDGTEITQDVESLDINISNGMEAKGALNSLYNVKLRRATPQTTEVTVEKNAYDPTDFSALRTKMLAGTPATVDLTLGDGEKQVTVNVLKGLLSRNARGDYKGAGSHSIAMSCSAKNDKSSHLAFTFPAAARTLKAVK